MMNRPKPESKRKVLFVCTTNTSRSKTGSMMYRNTFETKSAGINASPRSTANQLNRDLIDWADIIIVFEKEHVNFIERNFQDFTSKILFNLEISDQYKYMQDELVKEIRSKMKNILILYS